MMKLISKQLLVAATLTVIFAAAPALQAADNVPAGANTTQEISADFKGRPPFKRVFKSRDEVADLARFEETVSRQTAKSQRVVDFKGRPPFRRSIASAADVADFARFEETTASPKAQRTHRGPPGKITTRR